MMMIETNALVGMGQRTLFHCTKLDGRASCVPPRLSHFEFIWHVMSLLHRGAYMQGSLIAARCSPFPLVLSDRLNGVITNAFVSENAPVPNACSATIPHSTHSG